MLKNDKETEEERGRVLVDFFNICIVLFIAFGIICFVCLEIRGTDINGFYPMQATAYCIKGRTASGKLTREGICASKPEWIGKVAAVYLDNDGKPGEFIGYFEILDTGGASIRKGKVIDIWFSTKNECMQFGRKKVLVKVIDSKG